MQCLAIDPGNSQVLYVSTKTPYVVTDRDGVWKSSDGGINWTRSSTGLTDNTVYSVAIDPGNSQVIYAGAGDGVWKSSDGGINWVDSSSGLTDSRVVCLVIDPSKPQTLYAGTSGGVWKSSDGGINWVSSSDGLTDSDVQCLAVDSSSILYAGTKNGLFRLVP